MISSNGAAGGNYEGNRLQILSELMGIDSSQFYATEAHATRVSNIEAAILEHKKQEPAKPLASTMASMFASASISLAS